jgi:chloramphenicol 3-O-phosphotransferase
VAGPDGTICDIVVPTERRQRIDEIVARKDPTRSEWLSHVLTPAQTQSPGVALCDLTVVWVGIRCSAEVAEERMVVATDSPASHAQTATVHQHARYDFEIDTTTQAPADAVLELTRRAVSA